MWAITQISTGIVLLDPRNRPFYTKVDAEAYLRRCKQVCIAAKRLYRLSTVVSDIPLYSATILLYTASKNPISWRIGNLRLYNKYRQGIRLNPRLINLAILCNKNWPQLKTLSEVYDLFTRNNLDFLIHKSN